MAITRKFRETVLTRAQGDARFRAAMLTEAINDLLAGELDSGKAMLRDYVNATISFEGLAKATRIPTKACNACWGPAATRRRKACSRSSRRCRNPSISS
jgi:hypothetical protein